MSKSEAKRTAAQQAQGNVPAPAAAPQLPTTGIDYGADAGVGLEGADRDSFAIPFLAILQPMSPVVVDQTVPDAKPGMFLNTVTNDLLREPLLIPCAFQRRWLRWASRDSGGGFKGELTTAAVNELRAAQRVVELNGRLYFPEQDGSVNPEKSDRLSDTRSHFCLVLAAADAPLGVPAVFALTSTGIKVSKNWLSRMDAAKLTLADGRVVTAPTFSQLYRVTTEKKSNDKGTWWQPVITPAGQVTSAALYAQAKAFHSQVSAGKVDVAHESMAGAAAADSAGGATDDDARM